ncbi:MAG: ABC transporter permease [Geminicoccaceae bacterium]
MSGPGQAVVTMAMNEWRIGRRNRWVLIGGAALAVFALLLAMLGSTPGGSIKASETAIITVSLTTLCVYLVPLLALILAQDAIVGESERGTLILLLTYPLARSSLLVGKFIGHFLILCAALTIGLAAALAVVLLRGMPSAEDWMLLGRLWSSANLLGAAYLAGGYVISGIARDRSDALALAFGFWIVTVVLYDVLLLILLSADLMIDAFPWLLVLNPGDAFRLINLAGFEAVEMASGLAAALPELPFPTAGLWAVLAGWLVLGLLLAHHLLQRREA